MDFLKSVKPNTKADRTIINSTAYLPCYNPFEFKAKWIVSGSDQFKKSLNSFKKLRKLKRTR